MGKLNFPSKFYSPALLFTALVSATLITSPTRALTIEITEQPPISSTELSGTRTSGESAVLTQCATMPQTVRFSATVQTLNKYISELGATWRLENEGIAGVDGMPDLPVVSRWVIVPPTGELTLSVDVRNQFRQQGEPPARFRESEESEVDAEIPALPILTGLWPPSAAIMSEPMVWRGVRLVNLVLYPVQWDGNAQEYVVNDDISTEIVRGDGVGVNEVVPGYREPCRDFDKALQALVVNPPARDDGDESYQPGSYLIVANEDYPAAVDELVEWKRQSGHKVTVMTFVPQIMIRQMLKAAIVEFYQQENFSYLILIGNEEADPPLEIPYDPEFYDNYFGQLEGNDPIADVAVGTYNCLTAENLTCAIRRTISYEKNPDIQDDEWFTKGFVGVGACSVPDDLSPSYSGKWVQAVLEREGYEVASSYFSDNEINDPSPDVVQQYNAGVNMIIVRGHQTDFRLQDIQRRGVYPFHFMVSSSTISQGGQGSFNRAFRLGLPEDMRGPSAGFGHNPSPRTNIANAIVGGLVEALYHKDIQSFGWARNYLTAKIPIVMPADQGQIVTRYWGTLRYYGDPGQEPWIGVPQEVRLIVGAGFNLEQSALNVMVRTMPGDENVAGATVSVYQEGTVLKSAQTDANGRADILWTPGILSEEPMSVTVTGRNLVPVTEVLQFRERVGHMAQARDIHLAEDDFILPGVEEGISLTLANNGTVDIVRNRTVVSLFSEDEGIEFAGEYDRNISLAVGESVRLDGIFTVTALPRAIRTGEIECHAVALVDGGLSTWTQFTLAIEGADLELANVIGEENAAPGEDLQFSATLFNQGVHPATNLIATFTSLSPFALVLNDEIVFSDADPDGESEQQTPFSVRFLPEVVPGTNAEFQMVVQGDPGLLDTMRFSFPVGIVALSDPVGPDKYGYIAIENGDDNTEWADAPEYNWVNISPWGGDVQGTLLDLPVNGEEDSSVVVDLPFNFRYYGQNFNQITVCNNGWIAMDDQIKLKNQQNWPLPGYNGAWGMIAPFWDRLFMQTRSDGVFYYSDEQEHKVVIQWQTGTKDEDRNWFANAFQVTLFDPVHYETVTGDSPFLFQYETVNDVSGDFEANFKCSVGISSPDGKDGLTYSYWGMPSPGGRNLEANRAVLWTTVGWEPRAILTGRVVRYIDSTGVAGAVVRTSNDLQTVTNDQGDYLIVCSAAEGLTLSANAERYGEAVVNGIDLIDGEVIRQDFVLPHGWFTLPEGGLSPGTTIGNMTVHGHIEWIYSDSINTGWFRIEPTEFSIESEQSIDFFESIDTQGLPDGEYEVELHYIVDDPQVELMRTYSIVVDDVKNPSETIPIEYALSNPFPNPFNSRMTIRFSVPQTGKVSLILTDVLGREVRSLTDADYKVGDHQLTLNAGDLPTGLYLVRMQAGSFKANQRVLLIR